MIKFGVLIWYTGLWQPWEFLRVNHDNKSYFTELLEIVSSVSVPHRNIQVLATELYKVNGLSPKLVSDYFELNNMTVYNARNSYIFYSRPVRTVLEIWKIVLKYMKNLLILTAFKNAIKQFNSWIFRWIFECTINFFFKVLIFI